VVGVSAIVWGMATEKLKGVLSIVSNSPNTPTGYGVQVGQLVEMLKKHGVNVAVLSNFGTEGMMSTHRTKHGDVPVYPKGNLGYSEDVIQLWHQAHRSHHPDLPHAIFTLYDVWVYNKTSLEAPVVSWVPLDHVTIPPLVKQFLSRDNVTPVAMSPHGQRQLQANNLGSHYVPHTVDTKVFQRTEKMLRMPTRELLGIAEDTFLVGMVMANKANGIIHRKAYAEQMLAFGIFHKEHPNSHLYIHADHLPIVGGFHLEHLREACGIPKEAVTFANRDELRVGYSDKDMAALYSAMDVLMMATYGEGFGVPVIEAQACGTRVIASNWAATQDLVSEDGFLVEGQPFWDEPQKSFYQIPMLGSLTGALQKAYEAPRGPSVASRSFALQFDTETVWEAYWLPFFRELFSR
jgi:glycosyltransferase involved in cell wall biosynthesis